MLCRIYIAKYEGFIAVQASKTEFSDLLGGLLGAEALKAAGPACVLFYEYYLLTLKWGEKINITANLSPEAFVTENLADPVLAFFSAVPLFAESSKELSCVDLGCGGGYVGLVWHILSDGRFETELVDGDRKKINFCRQVIRELGLSKIRADQLRVEALVPARLHSYGLVVSRATWDVPEFFKKTQELVRSPGLAIHFSSEAQAQTHSGYSSVDYVLGAGRRFLSYRKA
jgi:16S rRNA G527 N7-methylase RsmG